MRYFSKKIGSDSSRPGSDLESELTTDFGSLQPHLSAQLIADLNASIPLLANGSSAPSSSSNASTLPPKRDLLLNSLVNGAATATPSELDALLQRRSIVTDEYGNGILHTPNPPQRSVTDAYDLIQSHVGHRGNGVSGGSGGVSLAASSSASSSSTLPAPLKLRTLDTGKATLDHFNIEPL